MMKITVDAFLEASNDLGNNCSVFDYGYIFVIHFYQFKNIFF